VSQNRSTEFQWFAILTQRRQERQEELPSFAVFAPLREPKSQY